MFAVAADGLRIPESVGLEGYGITCAGDGKELSRLFSTITELNISDNKFTEWHEVCVI